MTSFFCFVSGSVVDGTEFWVSIVNKGHKDGIKNINNARPRMLRRRRATRRDEQTPSTPALVRARDDTRRLAVF